MSNVLAGIDWENVAREGFSAFVDALIPINVFSTDLSGDIEEQGTVVKTRIVPAVAGTVGDLIDTHTGSYSNAIDDFTLVSVPVTLDSDPIMGWHWTEKEIMQMSAGVMSDTASRIAKANARAVANKVLDVLFAAIDATYTAGATVAVGNFDADDMWDVRKDWVENAGSMNQLPKCILDAAYYAALGKDNALQDRSASGLDATLSGNIPRVAGFGIIEAPSLAGAAAANTTGFACLPSAMAIAMRGVGAAGIDQDMLAHEVMVDDQTGVVLTYKAWVDRDYQKINNTYQTMWGRADAVTTSLRRIVSS